MPTSVLFLLLCYGVSTVRDGTEENTARTHSLAVSPSGVVTPDSCECMVENADSSESLQDWLELATTQNTCCQDYGPRFGWWGEVGCPASMSAVYANILEGQREAVGGKSGTKPIMTQQYVIKLIDEAEFGELTKLLDYGYKPPEGTSLIVPTCRVLRVASPGLDMKYVQISPNVNIQSTERYKPQVTFDLKGNYAYPGRKSKESDEVLKDIAFYKMYEQGLKLTKVQMGDTIIDIASSQRELEKHPVFRHLEPDTAFLSHLGLMDYSILAQVVELCPAHDCPSHVDVTAGTSVEAVIDHIDLNTKNSMGTVYMGSFTRVCVPPVREHDQRPIYMNSHGQYLFYWAPHREWVIGADYLKYGRGVAAPRSEKVFCPDKAEKWWAHAGDENQEEKSISRKGWTSAHSINVIAGSGELLPSPQSKEELSLVQSNLNVPLIWAEGANNAQYLMTLGVIDLLMHEDSRGFLNAVGTGVMNSISWSDCAPNDPSPIKAAKYRARFLHMFGFKDPAFEEKGVCGACYGTALYAGYIYFPTDFQEDQNMKGVCEWALA